MALDSRTKSLGSHLLDILLGAQDYPVISMMEENVCSVIIDNQYNVCSIWTTLIMIFGTRHTTQINKSKSRNIPCVRD
jgi:hypothetical protein